MDMKTKVAILRQHETYCYQICYYLIQDERLSMKAASEALLEVFCDPDFFIDTAEGQKKIVRLVAARSSLKKKADC